MNSDTYILPREGQFGNAKVEEGGVAVSLVALADSQRASDFGKKEIDRAEQTSQRNSEFGRINSLNHRERE